MVRAGHSPPPGLWKDKTSGKLENLLNYLRKISWTALKSKVGEIELEYHHLLTFYVVSEGQFSYKVYMI